VLTCALFSVCLVWINNKSAHIPRTRQRFCSPHTTHAHTPTRGNPLVSDPPARAPVRGAAVHAAPALAPTAHVPTSQHWPQQALPKKQCAHTLGSFACVPTPDFLQHCAGAQPPFAPSEPRARTHARTRRAHPPSRRLSLLALPHLLLSWPASRAQGRLLLTHGTHPLCCLHT